MSRTLAPLGVLLLAALPAHAQTNTATFSAGAQGTFTVQGPNGEPIVVQGGVIGGIQGGGGIDVGPGPNGPARDNRPQTGTGLVRGRITTDSGQPLRRAPVRLNGAPTPHVTTTDLDGRYEFTNLPAGHFTVLASRAGYIGTNSDAFDLSDGERRDNVNVRVPRGGVISGVVTDEFGEPVIGATVVPMRSQFTQGQRRVMGAGASASTNDIGEYRLYGLTPGQYYVSVSPRNEAITINMTPAPGAPIVSAQASPQTGYAPTYFPGTPDVSGAQRLTLGPSQSINNVNFSLTAIRLSRVSGVAMDADGKIVTRGAVTLMPRGNGVVGGIGVGNGGGQVRADGGFTIVNVAPGDYTLRLTIPPAVPPVPRPAGAPGPPVAPAQFATAAITVNGDDLNDIVLAPLEPAVVHGRILFDDVIAGQSVRPGTVRLTAQPVDFGLPLIGGPSTAVVADDFSFEMTAAPVLTNLRVGVLGTGALGPIWYTRAIRYRGVDVTDRGLELKSGESADDVEVELTTKSQTISGTVITSAGAPAKNALVVVFAQDRERWLSATTRYTARAITKDDGTFKTTSLPPGNYYILTAEQGSSTDWNDPDVLDVVSRNAATISLSEGDAATVNLKVSR
jgi:uncharacterized protein (DUF2141 family)